MWAYESACGSPVMSIRLDDWIVYAKTAGITDDWWELREACTPTHKGETG